MWLHCDFFIFCDVSNWNFVDVIRELLLNGQALPGAESSTTGQHGHQSLMQVCQFLRHLC